jgi:diguanylate cyclase (GGDEF)-like protein/PAS domain S-box-containing protein
MNQVDLNKHAPARRHKRMMARQWAWMLLAWLLVLGWLGYTQWREFDEIEAREKHLLHTQNLVAEQLLTTQLLSADAALRTLLEGLPRWRVEGRGYGPFAQDHLVRVEKMIPGIRTFVVLDELGICQLSNRTALLGRNFAHRDYYLAPAASQSSAVLHITPPYNTALGVWSITVSRPVLDEQNRFRGVVAATLAPDYFQQLMNRLSYADDMYVSLIHDQGRVYVTSRPTENLQDIDLSQPESMFSEHRRTGQVDSYSSRPSFIEPAQSRFAAFRTLQINGLRTDHGFVAVTSRDPQVVFGPWHAENLRLGLTLLVLVVLSVAYLWLYQRWVGRLQLQADRADEALRVSHQRYESMASHIPCVLFEYEVNSAGQVNQRYISPYCQTLLGYSAETLMADGQVAAQLVHEDDRQAVWEQMRGAMQAKRGYNLTFRVRLPNKEVRWVQMSGVASVLGDDGADVTHWSGFVFDLTERKLLEAELHNMAYHDPLTGVHNRRSFMDRLTQEIFRVARSQETSCLLMLDIDHFKNVNDTHGHDVGDRVLKHLVTLLQSRLRTADCLGRLGGEEFAILLPDTDLAGAHDLAEQLRELVASTPMHVGPEGEVALDYTVSLGLTRLGGERQSPQAVLKQADNAMYQAKQIGRNRVCQSD